MVKPNEIENVTVQQPESTTIESLKRTLYNVEQLQSQLPEFLALSDPDHLSTLPLLQRAHSLFSLAKLTSTLFECSYFNATHQCFSSKIPTLLSFSSFYS